MITRLAHIHGKENTDLNPFLKKNYKNTCLP